MKNILYVLDNFPKLSETFVLNEIVELINNGINVNILALGNPKEKTVNDDVMKYGLLEKTIYLNHALAASFRDYLSILDLSNIPLIMRSSSWLKFNQIVQLKGCSWHYRDIELVHAHFANRAAVAAMLLGRFLNKPFTFTAHAYEIFCTPFYSQKRLKMITDNAAMVITPSEYNKTYIIRETGCQKDRIKIVRATISPEKFRNGIEVRKDGEIEIITVGRLVEKKGFEYLIKAMKVVETKRLNVILKIIGSGPKEESLKELSNKLGLSSRVVFLGEQSNESCMEEILSSDIAILPCIVAADGDRDVCPLTLQEAMAMEVPVISTAVGSIPELVDDGVNGLLVPEKDERALANAIIRLIENPELRRNLGLKGREKILKEFNIKVQVDNLLKIWEEVII